MTAPETQPAPNPLRWLLAPPAPGSTAGDLWPRWIFLRLLGVWFLSVFHSLWFQVRGLIGSEGILPVGRHLDAVAQQHPGAARFLDTPTLLWWASDDRALLALCGFGAAASLALLLNLAPRLATLCCTLAFLSFSTTLQRFASYQSDGMLLEAGLVSCFFAPAGWRPGLGAGTPPSRLSRFALLWLGFRIYFESGFAKYRGQDPEWLGLTAMDHYYENGPLPTWLAWYVQQRLPHAFHAATAFATLALELVVVWAMLLPRWAKIPMFFVLTPFQLGIIATANYAFLNYLVLSLGVLLLDDRFLRRFGLTTPEAPVRSPLAWQGLEGLVLGWHLYATAVLLPNAKSVLPVGPAELAHRFRFANGYGLFGRMTRGRYELEYQGTTDGVVWKSYAFRYKPQDPHEPPGIYAPYQPRFEWNLWFASLSPDPRRNPWVIDAAAQLLRGSADVRALFRDDPFAGQPPVQVRVVRYRYRFTTPEERRATGAWWHREGPELFGPVLERQPDGAVVAVQG